MTVLRNAQPDVDGLAASSIWWQEGIRPTEIDDFSQEFLIGTRQLVAARQQNKLSCVRFSSC